MTSIHTADILYVMNERFSLFHESGRMPNLWTRSKGTEIRQKLLGFINSSRPGDTIIIDLQGIEVFDISFASELFGRTILSMPMQFPDRYIVVTNLSEFTRENLVASLEKIQLAIVEYKPSGELELLGKYHQVDQETFAVINTLSEPVTAVDLKDRLGIKLQAMNERLNKLVDLRVVRREKSVSAVGREQYIYSRLI